MEQLVLLVVIGLISLVNWVMQKAAEKREAAKTKRVGSREVKRETRRNVYTQPAPAPTARRAAAERDPFKELMDALGLPAETVLPPTVTPQTAPEQEEEEFVSLEAPAPPALPQPVVTKPRGKAAAWHPPARGAQPDEKMKQLASAFVALDDASPETWRGGDVRSLLANASSQRKAVILSEILGTPRGLARPDALMTRGHL
jgi:hypothetical protein